MLIGHNSTPEACPVYRPRRPHLTPFYQCVQDHYETLEQVYPERFAKRYGFWRPYLKQIMVHYLECGDFVELSETQEPVMAG